MRTVPEEAPTDAPGLVIHVIKRYAATWKAKAKAKVKDKATTALWLWLWFWFWIWIWIWLLSPPPQNKKQKEVFSQQKVKLHNSVRVLEDLQATCKPV